MKDADILINRGIFGLESNFKNRFFKDYKKVKHVIGHFKGLGCKVVLTQGTYDMVHIGHARYLEDAKRHGDFLIVGVDSDEKVRNRKGPDRPVVPEEERLEMLTHLRCVDAVVLKGAKDPKWSLIKTVQPDVLIATKETYTDKQIKELKKYCREVIVLDPKATTSTSAKIRLLQLGTARKVEQALTSKLIKTIDDVLSEYRDDAGRKVNK
ncbi:MAG: adenylyltransferase/cytidyltransferase family protein [bacterium]|nr:adenylyltransferase/cytidyltransferase family protein [bacterium]